MQLELLNSEGKKVEKKVKVSKDVFAIEPNDHSIYLDVKQFLANNRQGTHCIKGRALIAGSTKKLRKQKGSGAARVGGIKSPLFRGGGTMHGPQPKDWSFKLNKKVKVLARKSALSYKVKDKAIFVAESIAFPDHKTKNAVQLLNSYGLADKKTLVVLEEYKPQTVLAFRNIEKVKCVSAQDLNTYMILDAKAVIFTPESLAAVEKSLNS